MISDRYLCKERVLISPRNAERAEAVTPVRKRFIKVVFFFNDESRDLLVSNRSMTMKKETKV